VRRRGRRLRARIGKRIAHAPEHRVEPLPQLVLVRRLDPTGRESARRRAASTDPRWQNLREAEAARIAEHELLLLLTEVAAYAFVGRRAQNGGVFGYHTADPVLVESLVARLQDQYYLQGRF
jgi:hypothetical protein